MSAISETNPSDISPVQSTKSVATSVSTGVSGTSATSQALLMHGSTLYPGKQDIAGASVAPNFELLQNKMNRFHNTFRTVLQNYQTQLIYNEESYKAKVEDLNSKTKEMLSKIEGLNNNEFKLFAKKLNNEVSLLNDLKFEIDKLTHNENLLNLDKQDYVQKLENLSNEILNESALKKNEQKSLNNNLNQDLNYLKVYELFLGLKISSISDDILKFTFSHLKNVNDSNKYSLVLDVSDPAGTYKVGSIYVNEETNNDHLNKFDNLRNSTNIPDSLIRTHLQNLNVSRDLTFFLKNIRKCFQQYC